MSQVEGGRLLFVDWVHFFTWHRLKIKVHAHIYFYDKYRDVILNTVKYISNAIWS